jgi:hypothetical protein
MNLEHEMGDEQGDRDGGNAPHLTSTFAGFLFGALNEIRHLRENCSARTLRKNLPVWKDF